MIKQVFILLSFVTLCSCNQNKDNNEIESQVVTSDSIQQNDSINNGTKSLVKAPGFNFLDVHQKKYSLDDFKGNYIYIDAWATWCGPCLKQIPYMKQLEEKYKDAPIKFVSISLDAESDKDKWQKFVVENQMSGIQLFGSDKAQFAIDYQIEYIPRFILIDKEGNLMMEDAPAPMSNDGNGINTDLVATLDKLK
jgi:thiol-disulfide isomerase/thioredoxin